MRRSAELALKINFQIDGLDGGTAFRLRNMIEPVFKYHSGRWRVRVSGAREDELLEVSTSGPTVETVDYIDRKGTPQELADALTLVLKQHLG